MAVTRIKNNQITDSTITAAKIASGTLTGGLFAADITLSSNVTITGNLTVSGSSDSISATNTFVNDPLVVFNNGFVGSPSYDIGILVNRNLTATAPYGSVNAALIWRESDKAFSGLMTTETGATTGTINNSGFANLRIGNVTANSLTLTSGTLTASGGITGTPISGSTGHFTVLQGTAFSTANAVITGGSLNGTVVGNTIPAAGWFTTLYGQNFSTGNAVISGGYISALTNATITTATTTTLNAGTATAAVLNATAGNVTTGYFGSLNTANAVITGGSATGLTNFSATTAQATNFSSGNIQATGSTAGTWSTANVSLYESVTTTTTDATFYPFLADKTTGNTASFTASTLTFNPSTGALAATSLTGNHSGTTAQFTNFSTGNAVISGGYISTLTNATVTTGSIGTLTATTLNATAGNVTTLYAGSLNTANAVITGGSTTGLTNFSATTAQATNFSSGNIQATGSTAGTWSTANVSLYQLLAAGTQSANVYVPFYDKATGNAAAYTNNNILFTPSTGTLYVPNVVTNSGSGGYFPTLVVDNFSSGNIRISGGYISALTNATVTTGSFGTLTAATLNTSAANVNGALFATSLNTANAVITGGSATGLTNFSATTAQATNFSSGNIQATGSTSGTWSTANVSLYQQLTASSVNANLSIPLYDKATGNAASSTGSNFLYNPSTNTLFVGTIATNGGNIGSGGGSTFFTTFYATNFSTGNAQITGGNTTGLTNFSATTGQITNFSTGNAQITGGAITATTGNFGTATATTLNATAGNITTLQVTNFSTGNAVISGGYISALANATVTTASITNLAATTATATNFASGNVAITGGYINSLANLTATTAQATNFSTGNARITGGYADNFPIGANTAATGAFTTLTASGVTTLTNSTDSTSTGTGALQVTGGVGILGNLWVGGNLYVANIIGRVSSTITVQDPLLYLSSNSATYNYDIGIFSNFVGGPAGVSAHTGFARDYSANQWKLFSNVKPLPGGTVSWADPGLIFDSLKAGDIIAANSTASTSTATGALQVAGGAGIAGNLNAGNLTTSMTTGTVMGNVGNFNNIYGTFYGTVAGGAGSANVSLYQTLTDASVNSSHFVAIYDKATGNAAAFTDAGLTYNPSTGALSATSVTGNHYGTTAQFNNFSTANAVISGGYISALTNATVTTGSITNLTSTTAVATNFSTGNAQITGGSATGLTNFSATTAQATNFSTGNAQITGGSATGLTNFSATTAQATNFSSGNIQATGSTSGTWSTANVSLYESVTTTTTNATFYPFLADKTTGNTASFTASTLTFNPSTGVLSATTFTGAGAFTTLQATNFSSGNVVISGGYINNLANVTATAATIATVNATVGNITTLQTTNFSTANASITGGSVTGLTNFSATTGQVTNFSTGNAVISGGYISALTNATITTGTFTTLNAATATTATLNATAGNVTTLSAQNFSTGNAVITGGSIAGLTSLAATTLVVTNFSTGNAVISGGYISALTNAAITTATITTLNATAGNVTTLAAGSISTANAVISGGYISALTNATITTGSITNLTSTTAVATNFSSGNIQATGTTAGTWSTGNVALYGQLTNTTTNATHYINFHDKATGNAAALTNTALNFNPSTGVLAATTFSGSGASLTNLPATAVVGTVTTANVSLYESISASTTNATFYPQLVDKATGNAASFSAAYVTVNPSTNTLSANVFSGAVTATTITASGTVIGSGNIVAGSSTDSTSTTTGALVVVGGTGIAGNVTAGKAATFNSGKTAGMDFVVRGKTDNTLIWARPGASYDQVVIGNSATTSTLVTGAKLIVNTTDSIMLPAGTTAQRPGSTGGTDTAGMFRYNSTINAVEWYTGSAWQTASSQFTTVTDTQFSGDGSTVTFTSVNFAAATTNGLIVSINGVLQIPTLAYSLSGSTITFTEAPASADVIDVRVITTTATISSLVSDNGFMGFDVKNDGVYILTGTSSATSYNYYNTDGAFVSNIANVSVASANVATTVDSFDKSLYRSAKYTVQATHSSGYQVSEVLVIHDNTTATRTMYATMDTSANLGVTATTVSGSDVLLQYIAQNASTIVRVKKEYMAI
jgi:hypothetical protein